MLDTRKQRGSSTVRLGSELLHSSDPVIVQIANVNSIRVPVENEAFVRHLRALLEALNSLRPFRRFKAALGRGTARDGSDFTTTTPDQVALLAAFAQFAGNIACSVDQSWISSFTLPYFLFYLNLEFDSDKIGSQNNRRNKLARYFHKHSARPSSDKLKHIFHRDLYVNCPKIFIFGPHLCVCARCQNSTKKVHFSTVQKKRRIFSVYSPLSDKSTGICFFLR